MLGGVITVDLDGADHVEHARVLADIDRVRAQADAAQIDVVVSALANSVHLEDGHRSVNHWLSGVLDMSKSTAFAWKRRGELALRFPAFLEAFRDGRFTLDQYDAIARVYSNPRVRGAVGESSTRSCRRHGCCRSRTSSVWWVCSGSWPTTRVSSPITGSPRVG